jgi:hypothetical protein
MVPHGCSAVLFEAPAVGTENSLRIQEECSESLVRNRLQEEKRGGNHEAPGVGPFLTEMNLRKFLQRGVL